MKARLSFRISTCIFFTEIPETTEVAVKKSIDNQLKIEENIELHVDHRLRKRRDGCPRTIVANRVVPIVYIRTKEYWYFFSF
jgi:hypothetical protein